jgi:putative Mn2+ efflux pump MntP
MLALLLVAVSLGLSNFAAAIAIGVGGVDARTRLRVGLAFGLFEAGMPLLGLLLGHGLAGTLGHAARWIGAALLIATGLYTIVQAFRRDGSDAIGAAAQGLGKLLISGFALSVDNLAVGFAVGTYHVTLLTAAAVIGAVSVTMALAGLELGFWAPRSAKRARHSVALCYSVSASPSRSASYKGARTRWPMRLVQATRPRPRSGIEHSLARSGAHPPPSCTALTASRTTETTR